MEDIVVFWFRRDLRITDNHGLYEALNSGYAVLPVFIFDPEILLKLENKEDARVEFIHNSLTSLKLELNALGSDLQLFHTSPLKAFDQLYKQYSIKAIYSNGDYEPRAIDRDALISEFANENNSSFYQFKDQVIFEKDDILNDSGNPYRVYTPYKNKWLQKLASNPIQCFPSENFVANFIKISPSPILSLEDIGFKKSKITIPSPIIARSIIENYDKTRNYPHLQHGTSLLGIHFRFGTISIREKALKAFPLNSIWLSELIWREFFMQLLYHFPSVVTEPFQSKFNVLQWRTSEDDFEKWCLGQTGYPIVDAGMRELNQTGHMHNRVRMIVASFLTKHLFIDWRWGEAYFEQHLLDYDLAANNGNWQWAAGTGADAQPYYRIFNPILQQQKFDPDFIYIKKWVPEFGTSSYIEPMIDHKIAVERAKYLFTALKK